MKTAYVHDRIFHIGGAEQLFFDLIEQDTEAHGRIFTLFSDRTIIQVGERKYKVTVALPRWLNNIYVYFSRKKLPVLSKIFDYRNLMVVFPLLVTLLRRKIHRWKAERLYISSFAAVKNIVRPGKMISRVPTVLYLHSPMQYIWENYEEYCRKLSRWQLLIFKPVARLLRRRDRKIRHYEKVYANSHYTASCARKRYLLNAQVWYPQLNPAFHHVVPTKQEHNYFLYIGRLVNFIRETDLIIQLFNELNYPLLVMWTGPDESEIKNMAHENIVFLWYVSDPQQKAEIIRHARWIINLTQESCWIGTMESLACGTPVFGYGEWGTAELVQSQQWLLVQDKKLEHLIEQFKKFADQSYDRSEIQKLFRDHYQANLIQ